MAQAIGKALRRPEGPGKVSGRALYVADLAVPGSLWGGTLRSPVPRGRLLSLDLDPDFDFDSVSLVLPADIPGLNRVTLIADDQPILCAGEIRHYAEPLVLVAAPDPELLARALAAIHPRIEELPPLLDMRQSQEVFKEIEIVKGDVEAVFAHLNSFGARVLEGTYATDTQEQMYIEPQGFWAWPPDSEGTVIVKGSLQCPFFVQRAVAPALGLDAEKVRVVQTETGGGFGGKEDYPSVLACHAALLAAKSGQPVRMIYDRHEDLVATPKRHPSEVRHKSAVDADGKLLALDIEVLLDGGAYTTLSPVVLSRACIHAAGAYRCDAIRIRGRVVATNHVPYGAFRGFGAPQVCFAIERQMDRIARELDLHPLELRRRNMLRTGDTTATQQRLVHSVGSEEVIERLVEKSAFDRHPWCANGSQARKPGERTRRGVGLSFFFHGAGFTGAGEEILKGKVAVELCSDGRVLVRSASTEIGQGTLAMFLTIAAENLGTDPENVLLAEPDTGAVPDSGPTVASRTCMVVGSCVAKACRQLKERIDAHAAPTSSDDFRTRAQELYESSGENQTEVVYGSPPGLEWDDERYVGDAYPAYGWAADVAEVEVDLDSFDARVTRFLSAVDVGRAVQPQLVEGQIEGGSLQAIGFAHLEAVSNQNGRVLQDRMATCIIPTSLDAPPFEVELIEVPYPHGPGGAKGVGELPMDGGAPAVASAIEDALGIHLTHLPATPERLLEAWLEAHPEERP